MAHRRHIDEISAKPRARELEVLVLGFSRTGTMSLKTALEQLGYNPYHMSVALRSRHLRFWEEALRAKFKGEGEPYGKEEFDKLLGDHDVLEDIPCILFVDELLEAHPDAKVILTNRDVDSWLESMKKTFFTVTEWKTMPYLAAWDKLFWGRYMSVLDIILNHWGKGNRKDLKSLRQTYIEHYAHIREVVPQSKLLEFESKDGWKPLCEFLGKDVPQQEYPRSNDAAATVRIHAFIYWLRIAQLSWKPLGAVGVSAVALWLGYRNLTFS